MPNLEMAYFKHSMRLVLVRRTSFNTENSFRYSEDGSCPVPVTDASELLELGSEAVLGLGTEVGSALSIELERAFTEIAVGRTLVDIAVGTGGGELTAVACSILVVEGRSSVLVMLTGLLL